MKEKKVDMECPFCWKSDDVYLVTQKTTVKIKNQLVEYVETTFHCKNCDEYFDNGETLDNNLLAGRNAYRVQNHLLTSFEMADIRKKYGLSQADFSLALGWGEVTVTRYESKEIQDSTYDVIMRMAGENPRFMLKMLEENQNRFTKAKFEKIRNRIRDVIEIELVQKSCMQKMEEEYQVFVDSSDKNGYTMLDVQKLNGILGCILTKDKFMYKVRLMKSLWYVDQLYFAKTGKSATGLVYLHRDMGALPIGNEEIVMLPAVKAQIEYYDNGNMGYRLSVAKNFKQSKLPKDLEEIIDQVVEKFKYQSAKEIVEYMHKEKAYKMTKENEIIPFKKEWKLNEF